MCGCDGGWELHLFLKIPMQPTVRATPKPTTARTIRRVGGQTRLVEPTVNDIDATVLAERVYHWLCHDLGYRPSSDLTSSTSTVKPLTPQDIQT
jgi:hypothetical protein